ncbi:hypothetical protein D3C71_1994170 [compost metagenome]
MLNLARITTSNGLFAKSAFSISMPFTFVAAVDSFAALFSEFLFMKLKDCARRIPQIVKITARMMLSRKNPLE